VKEPLRLLTAAGAVKLQDRWMIPLPAALKRVDDVLALHASLEPKGKRDGGGQARMAEREGRAWKTHAIRTLLLLGDGEDVAVAGASNGGASNQVAQQPPQQQAAQDESVVDEVIEVASAPLASASAAPSVCPSPLVSPSAASAASAVHQWPASAAPLVEQPMHGASFAAASSLFAPPHQRSVSESPFDLEGAEGAAVGTFSGIGDGLLQQVEQPLSLDVSGAGMVDDAMLFAPLAPQRSSSYDSSVGLMQPRNEDIHAFLRARTPPLQSLSSPFDFLPAVHASAANDDNDSVTAGQDPWEGRDVNHVLQDLHAQHLL
jgi:hypothetical protein